LHPAEREGRAGRGRRGGETDTGAAIDRARVLRDRIGGAAGTDDARGRALVDVRSVQDVILARRVADPRRRRPAARDDPLRADDAIFAQSGQPPAAAIAENAAGASATRSASF